MSLSNCSKCQYFDPNPHHPGDITCGLNPAYASAWKRLESLDDYSKTCIPIDHCQDFKLDPAFEEKAIALSLNFFEWQKLERETSNPAIGKALKNTIIELNLCLTKELWQQIANSTAIPAVLVALAAQGIKSKPDAWIHVDSSCIKAIAYVHDESILKIKFNSGLIYEYDYVSESTFFDFSDAPSKGRFFNQHIKDSYNYRCC